jgi:putative Mn2+ efflux pump MntP
MSHTLSAILLAASSNLDNLGVGLAYGVRARRIRWRHNLLIALVSASGTFLSMAGGEWVNDFMSEGFADVLGATIMVSIGLYTMVHALRGPGGSAERIASGPVQPGRASETSGREGLALAVSLTLNNLGGGLGAGISHVSIPLTTVLTLAGSATAIAGGYHLGRHASLATSTRSLGALSGLMIVAVGIYEFFV